jgi:hypothetical protein
MAILSKQRSYVGLASATSADGTARDGASLIVGLVEPGSLSVQVTLTIVSGSVVGTFTPQVSMDGTTWYTLKLPNNAALVTSAATATLCLSMPDVSGWKFFRCVATLSGAATAAGDLTQVDYVYRKFGSA